MKRAILTMGVICLALCLARDGFAGEKASPAEETNVRLETSQGVIVLALDSQKAPKTVQNFLSYVKEGFYNGTVFHRVIKGFMIQGGGFTPEMVQKPTHLPIPNEADNGLKNQRGTVAMARTGDPHSATAQFFINTVNNDFLNFTEKTGRGWGYCVFGRVVEGMEVVDVIEKTATGTRNGHSDAPTTPVVIQKAMMIEGDVKR